jgi:hypothetical protein
MEQKGGGMMEKETLESVLLEKIKTAKLEDVGICCLCIICTVTFVIAAILFCVRALAVV